MDLLPRDAELARRAAGGDGAAFVRLYDSYSSDVFTTALAATRSVDAAAAATQKAFLRILRWPPRLGASDDDVVELLYALALGGPDGRAPVVAADTPETQALARLAGVGWLRSETVSKAGARFAADWSVYLWTPAAETAEMGTEPVSFTPGARLRRLRLGERKGLRPLMPRIPLPAPALGVAAVLAFVLFAGAGGTLLANVGGDAKDATPVRESRQAEVGKADKRAPGPWGPSRILRRKVLEPLLAP
jgi:hypothetical protein